MSENYSPHDDLKFPVPKFTSTPEVIGILPSLQEASFRSMTKPLYGHGLAASAKSWIRTKSPGSVSPFL